MTKPLASSLKSYKGSQYKDNFVFRKLLFKENEE